MFRFHLCSHTATGRTSGSPNSTLSTGGDDSLSLWFFESQSQGHWILSGAVMEPLISQDILLDALLIEPKYFQQIPSKGVSRGAWVSIQL